MHLMPLEVTGRGPMMSQTLVDDDGWNFLYNILLRPRATSAGKGDLFDKTEIVGEKVLP